MHKDSETASLRLWGLPSWRGGCPHWRSAGQKPSGFRRGWGRPSRAVLASRSPPQWPWAHFLAFAPVSVSFPPPPPPVVFKSLGVSVYLLLGMRMGWVGAALGFGLCQRGPHPPARLPPLRWCRFVSFPWGQAPGWGGPLKPIPASLTPRGRSWRPGGDRRCCTLGARRDQARLSRVGGAASGQSLCPLVGAASLRLGSAAVSRLTALPSCGWATGLLLPEGGAARWAQPAPQGAPSRVLQGVKAQSLLCSYPRENTTKCPFSQLLFTNVFTNVPGSSKGPPSPCLIDGADRGVLVILSPRLKAHFLVTPRQVLCLSGAELLR